LLERQSNESLEQTAIIQLAAMGERRLSSFGEQKTPTVAAPDDTHEAQKTCEDVYANWERSPRALVRAEIGSSN